MVRKMAVTINDIAKICNVSRTTVIRALNGTGRISADTKSRILKVAEEKEYHPDMLARALTKARTYTIGVVVLDVMNQHFSQILNYVEREARLSGYSVNIMLHDQNPALEKTLMERLVAYHVDGIILSSVNQDEDYVQYVKSLETPVVTIDNRLDKDIPFVGIDNQEALFFLTQKAVRKGYRRVVFVCPPLKDVNVNRYTHEQRYEGFCKAFSENPAVEKFVVSDEDYFSVCQKLLLENRGTAFLCSGDIFALNLMKHFKKQGKKAGKDYGIAGFDNVDILNYVTPQMDTINNNDELVAKKAVEMLMSLINKESVEKKIILDAEYINGETL